jgi:5-methylcytosine-specific restriction endonuclease McrA
MDLRTAKRIASGRVTLDDLREEASRVLAARTARSRRTAPRKAPGREAKAVKRAQHRDEMSAAREVVWAWNIAHNRVEAVWGSHPACDCGCGRTFYGEQGGEFDHWIERSQGGPDTRENGWRLHPDCHAQKTANKPSRQEWNRRRFAYCVKAGIPFIERRVRFTLPTPAEREETRR